MSSSWFDEWTWKVSEKILSSARCAENTYKRKKREHARWMQQPMSKIVANPRKGDYMLENSTEFNASVSRWNGSKNRQTMTFSIPTVFTWRIVRGPGHVLCARRTFTVAASVLRAKCICDLLFHNIRLPFRLVYKWWCWKMLKTAPMQLITSGITL